MPPWVILAWYRTHLNESLTLRLNIHSFHREEFLSQKAKHEKSKRAQRKEHVKAVINEQERLNSATGREELSKAATSIKQCEEDLAAELLRGVSCSLSKADKQRALGLALKDEKGSGSSHRGSARKLMMRVTSKLQIWANTSTKSLNNVCEGDDK